VGVSGCAEEAVEVSVVEDEPELEFVEEDEEDEQERDRGAGVSAAVAVVAGMDEEMVAVFVDPDEAVEDTEEVR
jgi:hypothetical protein